MLRYGEGLAVHTASSGHVAGLDTLHLRLVDRDGIEGVGEVRINIAYLNGLSPESVVAEALALLPPLDFDEISVGGALPSGTSAPLRMLIDTALHDLAARRAGVPLAVQLGADAAAPVAHPTNQTLFLTDDATFIARAEAYAERGFRDLKVRIGGDDAADLARIRGLRERFGDAIKIAADANGAWPLADARRRLDALAPFGLSYIEQPVAPRPMADLARLAEDSPVPIMLDESVADDAAVAELSAGGHRLMAHLKLVKLGGITPTHQAAVQLQAAGVPVMIGQMNEGGIATAAALHLAAALKPAFAELYGADGLSNDPASGLVYGNGLVTAPRRPGLGLTFEAGRTHTIWEN
jgi:L-alanine-DL-glutamate epimerase-like enolase superfamily enzyme